MNKEIQVLYTIFELELNPPFTVMKSDYDDRVFHMYNNYLEKIGYMLPNHPINFEVKKVSSISKKVKQVFNVDELSNEDVYHIAKHLFNWLQNKFSGDLKGVRIYNVDTYESIYYYNI